MKTGGTMDGADAVYPYRTACPCGGTTVESYVSGNEASGKPSIHSAHGGC